MVDLLINQLDSISNGMIINNLVINNNILSSLHNYVLSLLFQILSIIFVFSYCNDCKNNGNTIVGINIHTTLDIFQLQRYFNDVKLIHIRLIFCWISIFGDAVDIDLYLSKEYGNINSCLVCMFGRW